MSLTSGILEKMPAIKTPLITRRGPSTLASIGFSGGNWTRVADGSGNGNHGTLVGFASDPRTADVISASGKSIPFNGTDQYINVDSIVADLAATSVGSWSLWVKATDSTPAVLGRPFAICDTDANVRLSLQQQTTGEIRVVARNAAAAQWILDTNSSIDTLNWTHLALVQDGVSPVLYVNGMAVPQTFSTSTDKTFWFADDAGWDNGRIGCNNVNNNGNESFWDGAIDEVSIFTSSLSAANVTYLYNSFRGVGGGTDPGADDRVGYWTLN